MEEFEFKNTLLGACAMFFSSYGGLSMLRAGAESGNVVLGMLGSSICIAGVLAGYGIFKHTLENYK